MKWMGNYLGHQNSDDDVKNLIFPTLVLTKPAVTRDELAAIEAYYVSQSPREVAPAFDRQSSPPVTTLFKPEPWPSYAAPFTISLVHIDLSGSGCTSVRSMIRFSVYSPPTANC
jgi:hypothetical protein